MALVSKSDVLTALDATPLTRQSTRDVGGVVRAVRGYIAAASIVGATTGQWYTFCRLPARARLLGIDITNLTSTSGAVKVGTYRTTANGGAAVKNDNMQAIFVLGAGNDRAQGDTALTALQRSQSMADAFSVEIGTASATADVEFDLALTILTVIGTPVDVTVEVKYVDAD